jgi:hypothetical protein
MMGCEEFRSVTVLTAVSMNRHESGIGRRTRGKVMSVNAEGWGRRRPGRLDAEAPEPLARRVPGATLSRLVESDSDPDRAERWARPVAAQETLRSILEFDVEIDQRTRSAIRSTSRGDRGGPGSGSPDAGGESDA